MRRFVKSPTHSFLILLAILFSLVAFGADNRGAAQGVFRASTRGGSAELLPAPRGVRQQIREAKEALEQERYSDAVVRLGDLLRRTSRDNFPETAQDYFLNPERLAASGNAAQGTLQRRLNANGADDEEADDEEADDDGFEKDSLTAPTVLRQVREMIGNLPDAAMEIYQLRYGPLASKILQDAQPSRDWDAVEQVRREFFHTEAGYRATFLLAHREWLLGNPLATSLLLDDVVGLPRAIDQLGDDVIWLHAGACRLAERELPTPIRVPAEFAAVEGNGASAKTSVEAAWTAAVADRFSPNTFTVDPPAEDYPFLGGRPDRSGISEGQMPLSNARWLLESSGSPRQERMLETKIAELKANERLPPPSWMPLRVGNQLLMRTTQRLLGVDHRTGKRVWQYPWFSPPETIETPDDDDSGVRGELNDPNDILVQRVWNDVPYGQISSDGERVYMIDDLGLVESERFSPFGMRAIRSVEASKNSLVALDLATEGKLLWRLGSVETQPSAFSEAFFLGPPLPFRGRLYVMVEIAGEILLVCLNPQDGTEVWRQVLVSVQSSGITTDPVRRVAGAMPTYHEGLMICPTGAGMTIAVDLIDRTLRWVNNHPRNQLFAQNAFRQPAEMSTSQLSQRWATSVVVGHGKHIALTPVESDRMIVADTVTGQDRFTPQPRGRNLYLAGIRGNQYIIVRADRVMAYELETGIELWSTPVDMMRSGQRVSGRGVFGQSSYFLPTTTDELIEINLASGQVASRRNVRYPLGNLIAVDGEIISQAATTIAVAYGEESLRPNVDRMLAEDPDDFFAIVRKAELLMEQGERDEAIVLLQRARRIDPDSDEVVSLSVEAMLGSLRDQREISPEALETLRQLIDRPEQKAELIVLQVKRHLNSRDNDENDDDENKVEVSQDNLQLAFNHLLELSDLIAERPTLASQQTMIFPSEPRQFTVSAWVTARVAQIVNAADETTRLAIASRLETYLKNRGRNNRSMLEQLVEHFSPVSMMSVASTESAKTFDETLQNLWKEYGTQGDALAIERSIWGTRMPTDSATGQLDTSSLLSLAKVYSSTGWNEDRRHIGDILQSRIQLPDAAPESIRRITKTLDEHQVLGIGRMNPENWPRGVDLQWQSTNLPQTQALISDRRYARTTRMMGRQLMGWQAISDSNPLALLDHDGISRPIVVEGLTNRNSSDKEVTLSGGVMLVLTPSELIAIDLFRVLMGGTEETVRWRHSFHPEGEAVARRRSATSKFGDQIYRYVANSSTANADDAQLRLGPVLGDRVFLLQGADLICYHLVTGEQLWRTNTDIAGSGVVVGDGRVGVLSERADRVAFFDWYDGKPIDSQSLAIDSLVATQGRHALMISKYDETEGEVDLFDPYMLEIFDCVSMKRVRSRVASPVNLTPQPRSSSYGELVNGRYFTLLDNEGDVTIWDVLSGESLAEVTVPVRPDLYGLSVVQVKGRFLLMPRCKLPDPPVSTTSTVTVASGMSVQGATGIHCIEWQEGSPENEDAEASANASVAWSVQFDQARGMTTYQPWLTPMLMLVRGHAHFESTASRRRELDVWGLDVANGKVLDELLGKNIGSRNSRIETHVRLLPHRDQIIATIQSELLTYTFSLKDTNEEDSSEEDVPEEGVPEEGVPEEDVPEEDTTEEEVDEAPPEQP